MLSIVEYITDDFINFEPEHSMTLFFYGCNLNCRYCYNKEAITNKENIISHNPIDIVDQIINPMHSGLVLLGGESLVNNIDELIDFTKLVKSKYPHIKIKLFTNGYYSYKLYQLLLSDTIDFVSIDVKTMIDFDVLGFASNAQLQLYIERLTMSLHVLVESGKPFEVRTTLFESIRGLDIDAIDAFVGVLVKGADNFVGHIKQTEVQYK